MQILDGGSQNPSTIIITINSISQVKVYVCHVHGSMQYACMDVMFGYVCNGYICMP